MSVRYYDSALLDKVKNWIGDPRINVLGQNDTESFWRSAADQSGKDKIELPLVGIARAGDITLLALSKRPLTINGFKYKADKERVEQLNGIPISIPYQLDVYTRHREENDDLVREFVFKFINNPKLQLEIPYHNARITHVSNVKLSESITDNSDIPNHMIQGPFFRSTLSLYIDDAYLFNYSSKEPLKIKLQYDDGNGEPTWIE